MHKRTKAIISDLCGLLCLVTSIVTADVRWVIAAAIFRVAANVVEVPEDVS